MHLKHVLIRMKVSSTLNNEDHTIRIYVTIAI